MEIIQHQELASNQTSIVFNSIPQTYTDLFVLFSLRNDRSTDGASSYAGITINGNFTNLSQRLLQGNGSTTASFSYTSGNYPLWTYIPGSGYTTSTFQNGSIYISNYAGSTAKSISVDSVTENNATTAFQTIHTGLYNSSTAITSLGFISLNSDLGAAGNLVQYSSATLYGIKSATGGGNAKASGGSRVWTDGTYWYHIFEASGTFTALQNLSSVDYLVIAGGGSGDYASGGGGAGGYRTSVGTSGGGASAESPLNLSAGAYTVTVGAGGASPTTFTAGNNGSNSVFGTITSVGGGGGRNSGGSGGGADGYTPTSPGSGTANQGYGGGNSATTSGRVGGGAGGGAGAVGGSSTGSTNAGDGGAGVSSSITGTAVTRAGGGGGSVYSNSGGTKTGGAGGAGGGGQGALYGESGGTQRDPSAGTVNTGSGGGANGANYKSLLGNGGSGIVIVRYAV